MARVDTSESGGEFVPAPQGMYPLEVSGAVEKVSKGSKSLMFEVELTFVAGVAKGKKFRDWIMLEGPAADWHTAKLAAILGREVKDGDELFEIDLTGALVWGFMQHRTYQNDKGEDRTAYQIDGKAGQNGCGYVERAAFPWPETDEYTPPGVAPAGDADFEDIPF